jgi:ZIP family zinc transporter
MGSRTNPTSEALLLAFGMVTIAGLSTAFGAALVFCPCVRPPSAEAAREGRSTVSMEPWQKTILAFSLAFSGGVMIYVSFVEIFGKSVSGYTDSEEIISEDGKDGVYALATLTFFSGFAAMAAVNFIVTLIGWGAKRCGLKLIEHSHDVADAVDNRTRLDGGGDDDTADGAVSGDVDVDADADKTDGHSGSDAGDDESSEKCCQKCCRGFCALLGFGGEGSSKDGMKLMLSGVMTALAIGIHNFPEGLATFVGALDDPTVGAGLAFAIAIHNIPEGICVAFPVYYATAKPGTSSCCSLGKWRGFLWALFSGLSEPIGAAIGYGILINVLSDIAYAIVFGLVGGMMVFIVVRELLPTAHKYDPEDKVVTLGFFCGMLVMAASLVGFAARELVSVMVLCGVAVMASIAITILVFVIAYMRNNNILEDGEDGVSVDAPLLVKDQDDAPPIVLDPCEEEAVAVESSVAITFEEKTEAEEDKEEMPTRKEATKTLEEEEEKEANIPDGKNDPSESSRGSED